MLETRSEPTDFRHGIHSDSMSAALSALRNAKLRPTSARLHVLALMLGQPGAGYSIEDITRQLGDQGVRASLSTTYKAMRDLETCQLTSREWSPAGKGRYWLKTSQKASGQYRFVCCKCDCVLDVRDTNLRKLVDELGSAHHFTLLPDPVVVQVVCLPCQTGSHTSQTLTQH